MDVLHPLHHGSNNNDGAKKYTHCLWGCGCCPLLFLLPLLSLPSVPVCSFYCYLHISTEIVTCGLKTYYLCLILTTRPWPPRLFFGGLSLCVSSVFRPVLSWRQALSDCNPLSKSAFECWVEKDARASDKIHQLCGAGWGLGSWLRGKLHSGKLSCQCIPGLD